MRQTLVVLILLIFAAQVSAASKLELAEHQGQVVLVDFWASWCVPCRRSFPWMNEMQEKYAEHGLVIVGINLDREIADAKAFLAKYPAEFELLYDPDGTIAASYEVQVMPSSIIFARDGSVLSRHAGFKVKRQHEYEALIRHSLGLE